MADNSAMASLASLDDHAWHRRRQAFPETTKLTDILYTVYLAVRNSFYVMLSP